MGTAPSPGVLLYYWDGRDGTGCLGWWFGPKLGSEEVWAHHPGVPGKTTPPKHGWQILHSGEVARDLTVLDCGVADLVANVDDMEDIPARRSVQSVASRLPNPVHNHAEDVAPSGVVKEAPVEDHEGTETNEDVDDHRYSVPPPRGAPLAFGRDLLSRAATPQGPKRQDVEHVWMTESQHNLAVGAVGKRSREEGTLERERQLDKWLLDLDEGMGTLLQYKDVLMSEFDGDLAQIAASKNESDNGLLPVVDPSFWDTVKVRKIGHRMLFAKGIAQLTTV